MDYDGHDIPEDPHDRTPKEKIKGGRIGLFVTGLIIVVVVSLIIWLLV